MKFHVDMISRVLQLKLNATGYKDHMQKKKEKKKKLHFLLLSNIFVSQVIQTHFQRLEDLRIRLTGEDEKTASPKRKGVVVLLLFF